MEKIEFIELVSTSHANKPKLGQPCNNCGWCCITEVCPTGLLFTGPELPCGMLESRDGKHYCKLAPRLGEFIGIGIGCDAISAKEKLEALAASGQLKGGERILMVTNNA